MRQHASELLALLGSYGDITGHVLNGSLDFFSLLYSVMATSFNELHCIKLEKGLAGKNYHL